ncbi:MAG: DUF3122 domain-containing protein [Calothrix sp. C42_A2020_038]|nr:DUF3122 domain-containing protein [Calothrix sp. C42_A2020_038]
MYRHFSNKFWWLIILTILTLLIFLGFGIPSETVIAAATKVEVSPGEVLYRQENKLVDTKGNSWDVILTKRVYSEQKPTIYLRLIGCPGAGELLHPQPMQIISSSGIIWKAKDIFLDEAPAPTIGQYNLMNILSELPTDNLHLVLPLGRKHFVNILVPQNIVQQWQELAN